MKWNIMLLSIAALACREGEESHGEHEGAHHEEEHEEHDPADPRQVTIAKEMLRDLRITTSRAEKRAAGEGVTVLGEARINEDAYAEVGSPVNARVVRLHASAGDVVREGQALIELESMELGRARAELSRAVARARLAETALERKRALAAERIASPRELEEAEAEARAANADVKAGQTTLSAVGAQTEDGVSGSRFVLRSPIAGTVLERAAARGRMTDPEHPLFRIAALDRLWLVVHAFERDAVRVQPNGMARVTFPALPGQTFTGTVTLIGREVDPSSRTIPIRLSVANHDGVLRPGMSANAWLPMGESGGEAVTVPLAALQRLENGWCVFIPRGNGRFDIRAVGRGRDLGGEVEIVRGLAGGEAVVVEGAFLLKAQAEKLAGGGADPHHH